VDLSGEGIGIYERECLRGKERIFGILSGIGREEILIQKEGNQLLLVFSYGPYSL
jgi:hypothetical protein